MGDPPAPLAARNQHVKRLRALARRRAERDATGLVVVDGLTLARELVDAGTIVDAAYADPTVADAVALARSLESRGVPWHPVTSDVLAQAADTSSSQGVVLLVERPTWSLEDLGPGLVLALDGVGDPGNVGTALRSAAAVGAAGVLLSGGADPFAPKVVRAARGQQLLRPTVVVDDLVAAARSLGRPLVVADAAGEGLWDERLPTDGVVVVGNEAHGPSAAVRDAADRLVSIPMPGGTESLNAGVAASLLAYEWLRGRG